LKSTEDFRRELLEAGLLEDGGVTGLYHRSFHFEAIARGVEAYVSAAGHNEKNRQFFFNQVIARSTLEGSGYLTSFPDLIGVVSSFAGSGSDLPQLIERVNNGGDWNEMMSPTEVALCSAACHPVYPLIAGTTIPIDGLHFEVQAFCFRHEPSDNPARMQSFRQHEFVYVGTPDGALAHRNMWRERGRQLLSELGLSVDVIVANDPFFGRAGKLLEANQRDKELKYELVAPITSEAPGAISSANYHEDHFGETFDLRLPDGSRAHTACIGFGLERIALALLFKHGLTFRDWPANVKAHLSSTHDARLPEST